MTKRQKKKLAKRMGLFHYRDYKFICKARRCMADAGSVLASWNEKHRGWIVNMQKDFEAKIVALYRTMLRSEASLDDIKDMLQICESRRAETIPDDYLDQLSLNVYKVNKRIPIPMNLIYTPSQIDEFETMIKAEMEKEGNTNG